MWLYIQLYLWLHRIILLTLVFRLLGCAPSQVSIHKGCKPAVEHRLHEGRLVRRARVLDHLVRREHVRADLLPPLGRHRVPSNLRQLIDALLLGYADALVLPIASTFTVLPKVMAHSRGAPYCAFLGEDWQRDVSTVDLTLRCFRRDPKTKQAADWTVAVRREGGVSHLGASYWPLGAPP